MKIKPTPSLPLPTPVRSIPFVVKEKDVTLITHLKRYIVKVTLLRSMEIFT